MSHHADDKPLCDVCHHAHYDIAQYGMSDLCPQCAAKLPTCVPALRPIDPATLAAQSMPRQDGGLGAALWDMFANTHRPAH